jgi:uncharacterized membrane protein
MPYWPAWALAGLAAACAYPAVTSPPPADPSAEHYEARGQEPGWLVTIHDGRIDYSGNYGDRKISVAAPIRGRASTAAAT